MDMFEVGDIVVSNDSFYEQQKKKKQEAPEFGGDGSAVVVAVSGQQIAVETWNTQKHRKKKLFEKRVRYPKKTIWVHQDSLVKKSIEACPLELAKLPPPALSMVLSFLTLKEAAYVARVNKKFLAAFKDENVWKSRCMRNMGMDVEEAYRKEGEGGWMKFYKKHAVWSVEVVTVFTHRGGRCINGTFKVTVYPSMTVQDFLRHLEKHPGNRQSAHGWGSKPRPKAHTLYKPHDPSQLGKWDDRGKSGEKPNCAFEVEDVKNHSVLTIKEAGLCNGAVLEQREMMMCD